MMLLARLVALMAADAGNGAGGGAGDAGSSSGDGKGSGSSTDAGKTDADVGEKTLLGKAGEADKSATDGKTEKTGEADKATKKDEPKPVEWEKWSPKTAEGVKLDDASIKGFRELGKKLGFNGEQAQALYDFDAKRAQDAYDSAKAALEQRQKGWREELAKDAEYGGAKLADTSADLERAMKHYGNDPELRKLLNDTGYGDHPALIKFVARIGKAMREDKAHGSNGTAKAAAGKGKSLPELLYGGSPKS